MYSSTEKSFEDNWKKLQKQVKNPEVLQYLKDTWLPLKEYYVPAWTNHHCHLGVGSTSRVEDAHAMVKLWLQNSTGTLLEVIGFHGYDQSVEKERKTEAKKIFQDIGEDLFQRLMAEITPIIQHFQDVLTGKVPFDQIPKSQEDDQYYEDPLECKNIHGRPQGAKNKNKNKTKKEPSRFEIIEIQFKRRGRLPSKVTSTTSSKSQSNVPSLIMEVDSSENSEDSEDSLSKSIC
ncbi:hypothetical protein O181_101939 [Austropuccinia psidii MF-1]|uniref:Uncharacterized protein n=1 Tax=Austropuccinia psidii MF-1 TaxID=1389203 RepID=A0A9Q3JI75_9BASI|nr:hypothetical protein [Austropuccinia psidii MF-1]